MSTTIYGILFFVSILVVVLVHEAGHFTMAKVFGIKVEEFFVGFGPRLWSVRRGETEYGVKALPLGGYVKIAGMNPYQPESPEDAPRSYSAKSAWQRALVILAGPFTHFLIAIMVLTVFFVAFGTPRYGRYPVVATVVGTLDSRPSPAAVAGIKPGDEIVALNGSPITAPEQLTTFTRSHPNQQIELTIVRDGRRMVVSATPVEVGNGSGRVARIGVEAGPLVVGHDRSNPVTAVGRAVKTTGTIVGAILTRLGDVFGPAGIKRIVHLLEGAPRRTTDVSSIVGASRVAGQAAQSHDWADLMLLFVTINIFVGILNLVPLPPFDGGHLAVVGWEKATRRKVDQRRLIPVAAVVLGFVLLFSLSVLYLDIVNPIPNPFR